MFRVNESDEEKWPSLSFFVYISSVLLRAAHYDLEHFEQFLNIIEIDLNSRTITFSASNDAVCIVSIGHFSPTKNERNT